MATKASKIFTVISCGRDEYPGDGLYLKSSQNSLPYLDKCFIEEMGIELKLNDEVEISVNIISREKTIREKL